VLLVLSVPLISILFIVLLAGYAAVGEGFGVRARAETFTVLDQITRQAATRSAVSLYAAGMTPSGGLNFPSDLAVFPIEATATGRPRDVSIDLTGSQRFASGLIEARSPTNFEEIGFRAARERLSLHRDGDRFSVVNGLGADVIQLYYRDGGRIYALNGTLSA